MEQPIEEPSVRVGFTVIWKEQNFRCSGFEPYVRKDGLRVWLATWETPCRICGMEFLQNTSSSIIYPGNFIKTCRDHRGRQS
jgi:hypothetical protein